MNKEERMFKSYLAHKKRKDVKEIVATVEKRKNCLLYTSDAADE